MKKNFGLHALFLGIFLAAKAGAADLYMAVAAVDKQDYPRAFEIFRELAEMGHPGAQENLAAMYVNGEGVKRDNVRGYAWAVISLENGGGDVAKGIVDQLASHLTPAARGRVTEVQAQFGHEALLKTLLPVQLGSSPMPRPQCRPVRVVNPNDFYPGVLRNRRLPGDVIVETTVFSDGRAHDPRVLQSFPPEVFSEAARVVAMRNRYKPVHADGVAVPCVNRFKIKFTIFDGLPAKDLLRENIDATRQSAARGDPNAQLAYAYVIEIEGGVPGKDERPIAWYLKAAQAGVPAAQYFVGSSLLTGSGVEKDEAKGLLWLGKAANAGSPEAHLELANYHLRRSPDSAAIAASIEHFSKAVEGGSTEAAYRLAALLATGPEAALRNPTRAAELIERVEASYGSNPIWFEIRAAAHSAMGNFDVARKDQAAAVHAASKLKWNVAPQKARLSDYEAGKAWTGDLFAFY